MRLVWPFSIQSPASLIPSAETISPAVLSEPAPFIHTGISSFNSVVNEHAAEHYAADVAAFVGQTQNIVSICATVWLTGTALMILWALWSWLRLRHCTAAAVPEAEGVWICDGINSPFLLGIFKPKIYLPPGLDEESRVYAAAHEKAHIKRRDYLIKPIGFLLLAVCWFHPLIWLAYILMCRDIELACDEYVIRKFGIECKKSYSNALLQCSIQHSCITVSPLAFGEVSVKERVKNILNYKKPAFWMAAVSSAVCIAAAICFLTDPVTANAPAGNSPDSTPTSFNSLYLNSAEPEESHTYVYGALLYQSPYISSYFPDGSFLGTIVQQGNILTATSGTGEVLTFQLTKTCRPKEIELIPLKDILPQDTKSIIRRTYLSDGTSEQQAIDIWEITSAGSGTRLFAGDSYVRLFALIDLKETFPFLANGALWTYDPSASTAVPIRFDLEEPVTVSVISGYLSSSIDGEQTKELSAEHGETVFWHPARNGAPEDNTILEYCFQFQREGTEKPEQWKEKLSLRSAMDYQGLYGSKTYGISNNWLGAASSAIHPSTLCVDTETRELVISKSSHFPYTADTTETASIRGRSIPPKVTDMVAVQ